MAIGGGILILLGIILFFVWRNQRNRLASLRAANPSTVAELKHIASSVAEEIGPGSWQDYVQVRGKIQCDQPLQSQLKQTDCVYYRSQVIREYEEVTTRQDESGETIQETQRESETVSSDTQSIPFYLVDPTGQIEIEPDGADIQTVKILSEFRQDVPQSTNRLEYGNFSLTLGNQGSANTLGYKYEESILPMDREVLIVGLATDAASNLTIRKPTDPKQKFIISLKIAEELTQAASRSAKIARFAMIVCFAAGTVLILFSVI